MFRCAGTGCFIDKQPPHFVKIEAIMTKTTFFRQFLMAPWYSTKWQCREHRYRKSQNRLLEVCCVPATSAFLPRVSFFFSFLLQWPFTVLIKQTRQAVRAVKLSIFSWMSMVMRHILSKLWTNISGKKQIVYQAKKLVFGHYSYQFNLK